MYNKYPYTDFHELNTDWIIGKIKNVETAEANTKQYSEDAEAAKDTAVQAKDDAVQAKDDAVIAQGAAENARDAAAGSAQDAADVVTDTLNQINLLQARVDNIIPQGTQTQGNTELIDIRVGYDGHQYTSAGDAVRGQVSDTVDKIDAVNIALADNYSDALGVRYLTDKWALGNLDASGKLVPLVGRVTTYNFIKSDYALELMFDQFSKVIVCTYKSDYTFDTRTTYNNIRALTIPAGTIFKLTLYTDGSAVDNPYVLGNTVKISDTVDAFSIKYTNDAIKKYAEGKLLLSSPFAYGNLYNDGSISASPERITFIDYMSYDHAVTLHFDPAYNVILCTYAADHSLINRAVNIRPIQPIQIPANTLFRLCIYNPDNATVSDPYAYAEAVYMNATRSDYAIENSDVVSIFESFAVVGDSLACGYVGTAGHGNYDSNVARAAKRNWPSYLELKLGRPFTNLARGSSTAHDWRYGNISLDVDIATADIDTYCYMVGVGVNDARQHNTVGTSADIAVNKSDNADSFYGNYDYVIRQLIEYKNARLSQAKIFVFTLPPTESSAESYNAAIRYIAGLYSEVHCIDLYNLYYDEFTSNPLAGLWITGHSRPLGYSYAGDLIRRAINAYMITNYSDFAFDPWPPLE